MTSDSAPARIPEWQLALLKRHQLGRGYLDTALQWFAPLARALVEHQSGAQRPILVAINGCQGSGKTTVGDYLCSALAEEHDLNAVALSLDDFYLTLAERQALASSVHPLLVTRGVPGTHDMGLLRDTLGQLLEVNRHGAVAIPRFDKAIDDRRPRADWDRMAAPVQLVLLEGWCLGARSQDDDLLTAPMNELERNEDSDGLWRGYSNNILARDFQPLYEQVDQWVMLRAPSFDCVFDWRREQEQKLAATLPADQADGLMDDAALHRFIQHYERITRYCLDELPHHVNHLFTLNEQRRVTGYSHRLLPGGVP